MRFLKSNPIFSLLNSYLIDSPQPANISYMWNFGSLLGICLLIQILTGVFLAMHYTPNVDLAFISVEHIMRDVNSGWFLRYTHANVASFFFLFLYFHTARGLYYSSYKTPRVLLWSIGVIILILTMAIAFLGYVLPYGQMSLWGATVITNLLSAIPVFGKDLVESNNSIEFFSLFANEGLSHQVAFNKLSLAVLPTVGTVSIHAIKKGNKIRLDKREYLLLPYQFIAFLVGLIDGDGYIRINKTTKGYIAINLVIVLSLEDISTLEYIYSVLKLGKITKYPDYKNPICRIIINRTDLQEILFPLLIHHNIFFLTENRRAQFNLAMFIIKNEIKLYENIPSCKSSNKCLKDIYGHQPDLASRQILPIEYVRLPFFKNWLVGFTNAEGSFCMKNNNDGCFQLKKIIHLQLFEALKILFNTKRDVYIEKEKYAQFSVSSKTDIQTVINYFSFSGLHPLIGLKSIQYFKWLANLQKSDRYRNLNFPH